MGRHGTLPFREYIPSAKSQHTIKIGKARAPDFYCAKGYGLTRLRDHFPIKVDVRSFFYFTKYLFANLYNTAKDDKERLLTSFE